MLVRHDDFVPSVTIIERFWHSEQSRKMVVFCGPAGSSELWTQFCEHSERDSFGVKSKKSPGVHLSALQILSKVSNLIAFKLTVIDRTYISFSNTSHPRKIDWSHGFAINFSCSQ